jgi:ribosomal protein S18 acetylase RimI-like enzyme
MPSQDTETKAPPSRSNIKIIVLPKACKDESEWDQMIEKCQNFRLFALGESPEAFSSTLAVEKAFSKDVWASRLANPRATQLFAIHSPNPVDLTTDSGKIEALLDNGWIAQTVLVEIVDSEVTKLAADKSPWDGISQGAVQPDGQQNEKRHVVLVLNGVYVAPGFRHLGVGSSIVTSAIDEGIRMAKSRGFSGVHFQVRVDGDNALAVKLYERAGFEHGETERLVMGEKEKDGVKIPPRDAEILVMHRHIPF